MNRADHQPTVGVPSSADAAAEIARLSALLEVRTVERDRAREALNSFVYIASHDLGEPVRKVTGFGGLLRKRCGDELSEPASRYLGFMIDAAGRLGAQLDGLLEWSRVETHGRPFEPVELDGVARGVIATRRDRIEPRGAEVQLGELPVVFGDPAQIRMLLGHLLDNALTYHPPDRPPSVRITAATEGRQIRIEIADEGIGFESRDAERIFQPFVRLVARHEHPGVGMGLPICQRIAARHGGRILARATPGQGAILTIELPALEPNGDGP
jgi:signal transduction histidine kinase